MPPTPSLALPDAIPADRRDAVAAAIAATFPGQPVGACTRVAAGLSGAGVFRLEVAGRPYLLRVETHADGLRDPVRQYACMRIAAAAGVAPAPLHLDAATGLAITTFLEGPALADVPRPERVAAIAATLRALHAAPCFPPLIDFFDGMAAIWGQAEAAGTVPADVLARHRARYDAVVAAYPRDAEPPVASHNDLNPSNVLFADGRAWFVDWEVAFAADRYVDLASVGMWFCADEAEEAAVLRTYFGRAPGADERARYDLMLQVVRCFYGVMLLNGCARERPGLRLTAADLDGPSVAALRSQMGTMATWEGRVRFACAFLGDAYRASAGVRPAR